jgi:hypothetical protein
MAHREDLVAQSQKDGKKVLWLRPKTYAGMFVSNRLPTVNLETLNRPINSL